MSSPSVDLLIRMADAAERTDEKVGAFGEKLAATDAKVDGTRDDIRTIRRDMVGKVEARTYAGFAFALILVLILLLATARGVDVGPAVDGASQILKVPR